jgi:predicted XRE-type DNA-binding protein
MNEVYHGTGNVFADLGLPDASELHAKSMVSIHIERIIDANQWTQAEAAKRMGLAQPDVSNILRGKLTGFTLDRLFACLNALEQDVEIRIHPSKGGAGHVLVRTSE